MPPKKGNDASKKNVQKKKAQNLEDKTFGLKNKNKSKKVQSLVAQVQNNIMNSGDPKQRKLDEARKQQKANSKLRKKAVKDEQDALFGEALMAVQKKGSTNQKEGKVEALGRDGNDDAKKAGTSRAMKMMFQMDAQEMDQKLREDPNYVATIEDEIEMKRQQKVEELKKSGSGTKITAETLAAWQEKKRLKRQAEAKKLVEAELRKKKGGKGLGVLSGRALYEYKKELFKDRDDEEGVEYERERDADEEPVSSTNGTDTEVQKDLFLEGDDDDLDDLED